MTKENSYHFVGIGGIGMSALAHILLEKEQSVSGSDLSLNELSQLLQKKGASIVSSHARANIERARAVIYGSAIKEDNPELQEARERGLPILHRSELLAELISSYRALAVTGTHGKTTTSALLASVLLQAERECSFALGGVLKQYGINGHAGKDELFVLEADESDNSFLRYKPEGAIVTNIEEEHMECFGTKERLIDSFSQFISQVQNEELLFTSADDPHLSQMAKGHSYGFSSKAEYRIENCYQEGFRLFFDLVVGKKRYTKIEVAMIGEHNAQNAAAIFGLSLHLGLSEEKIRGGLRSFQGVKRRAEITLSNEQLLIIDDYAHHPTEIKTTLKALKKAVAPRRLIAIFQPHRYTRTKRHLEEFAHAFDEADLTYISEIYPASEKPIFNVTSKALIAKMKNAHFLPEGELLEEEIRSLDVVVTLGAGSITHFNKKLVNYYAERGAKKLHVGLVFGGKSPEHLISRRSASFVASTLNPKLYSLSYFGIDRQGNWHLGREMLGSEEEFTFADQLLSNEMSDAVEKIDLFFPVLHGPNGEDGTMQGFFEIMQKPYVGSDFRASAIGMDKVVTKRVLRSVGVKTAAFLSFTAEEWKEKEGVLLEEIEKELTFPLFIKAPHLGSSLGVERVTTKEEVAGAIRRVFAFDRDVLVEEAIVGGRELEFALLGKGSSAMVTPPGEKLSCGHFVDYEMKYGKEPVKTAVVADLDPKLIEEGRALARKVYAALGGNGMMRVDFLLDQKNTFWCMEVNPIPGMQKFSLFPKMLEKAGVSNQQLLDELIALALERSRSRV